MSTQQPAVNRPKQVSKAQLFRTEYLGRGLVSFCGFFIIALTISIGIFLIYKGTGTFYKYGHSVTEFLFSTEWSPMDKGSDHGGKVGSFIYIYGTLTTCALGLLIATPFSLAAAIFMTEISPRLGTKYIQPAVEIFVGIPSVVYGWIGLTILVPFIKDVFHAPIGGYSVLAAGIVLAVMIFPTITTVSADAIRSVPAAHRQASYGLGATRWQTIYQVVIPAASSSIFTGIILGLSRAVGEALAVSMVLGGMAILPKSILHPTANLTGAIAADMGNTASGGEHNLALWTMALLLFILSMLFIVLIHKVGKKKED